MADMITERNLSHSLINITDCQRDDHYHGATYQVREEQECEQEQEHLTPSQMLEHYKTRYQQSTSTSEREYLDWILHTLEMDWVPGNMGMLYSYVREFLRVIQEFEARCEQNGSFAKD